MRLNGIRLIVGLGNPGPEYALTRHNVGFWLIEKLCEPAQASLAPERKFKGILGNLSIANQNCRILMPMTYMNRSGEAILAVAKFYDITAKEILVVHDDLDLPAGTARLKFDGGHGGHNGLRDIVAKLQTKAFYRLRLGIGHPGDKDAVLNYVLHRPSVQDKNLILEAIADTLQVMPLIVEGQIEKAMHQLHTSKK